MFKSLINFLSRYWRRMTMKTLEVKKGKDIKTKADWEILCDTCAEYAEKANWNEDKTDKLIKHVRKELRG